MTQLEKVLCGTALFVCANAAHSEVVPDADAVAPTTSDAIRPFHIDIPDEALVDPRQRVWATRWPDKETVPDRSQGTQLAKTQELVRYWGTDYDWRKVEAKLNSLPQFMTTIDGLDIHFIQVRSRHPNALDISLPVAITLFPGELYQAPESWARRAYRNLIYFH